MSSNKQQSYIIPLSFIGIMFFAIGFALGINSFLIPVIQKALGVSAGASYLVLTATFSTFLIFGYPASLTIAKIGYKRTMALSFLLFSIGFAIYILSAMQSSFSLFLVASFFSGMGNTFLQASVNPYVTILGPIESGAKRISAMGICNKLAWPISPIFLAWVIGKESSQITMVDLYTPFYIVIAVFLLLGVMSLLAPLPEVKAKGEEGGESVDALNDYARNKTSIWQFPHLTLGAAALFFYVGVETIALSTAVDYATSLNLANAAQYGWIPSIGMVIGYICGLLFIPKYLSQSSALKICSIVAIVGSIAVPMASEAMSIWFISLMALGCSLMWPAIWPLAMMDLGKFTKKGSSLLVMAIAGGAIIPTVYGFVKDGIGAQNAYWVALPCFIFILLYGTIGYKIRTK